jgi:hypothetical protein
VLVAPSAIVGLILDMVAVSCDVEGTSYEELECLTKLCLPRLFTVPSRTRCFVSLVVTLQGYEAGGRLCVQLTSSHTISHHLPTSFPTRLKRKRDREIDLEIGGSC